LGSFRKKGAGSYCFGGGFRGVRLSPGSRTTKSQGPGLRSVERNQAQGGRSRDVQPMINPPVRRHSGRSTRDPRPQSALNSLEKIGFVLQNSDLEPCSAKIATDGPICWRVAPTL